MGKYRIQNKEVRDDVAVQLLKICRQKEWSLEELSAQTRLTQKHLEELLFGKTDCAMSGYVFLAAKLGKKLKITFE